MALRWADKQLGGSEVWRPSSHLQDGCNRKGEGRKRRKKNARRNSEEGWSEAKRRQFLNTINNR